MARTAPGRVQARAKPKVSVAEPKVCQYCGKSGHLHFGPPNIWLCGDCLSTCDNCRGQEPVLCKPSGRLLCANCAAIEEAAHLPQPPSVLPEERFGALFKAAQVLLSEPSGVDLKAAEDRIYPTLAFANEVGQSSRHQAMMELFLETRSNSKALRDLAEQFKAVFKAVQFVEIVDGVVILERSSAIASVVMHPETTLPKEVEVIVYRRSRLTEPQEVATAYEEAINNSNISCGGLGGSLRWNITQNHCLNITVSPGRELSPRRVKLFARYPERYKGKLLFPPAEAVSALYAALLGSTSGHGYARYLTDRRRGAPTQADNLIPACVAFYLKRHGKINSRKEIHRLLNEHGLNSWKGRLPEDGMAASSSTQLWEDVGNPHKVEQPLLRLADTLLFPN